MNPWWIEAPGPGRLAVCPRPRGGDWLEDDLRMLRLAGVDVLGSALTPLEEAELGLSSEEQLARDGGLQFVRLTTPDFGAPAMGNRVPAAGGSGGSAAA